MGWKSFVLLGTQFLLHLVGKLAFWRPRRGAAAFIDSYDDDGIQPTTPAEGDALIDWLRCTNCGLCEAVCPLEGEAAKPEQLSIAQLAAYGWRDLTAHRLVATAAQNLVDCVDCRLCDKSCPERIPLVALAESVAAHG